jgi:hypothetical protein
LIQYALDTDQDADLAIALVLHGATCRDPKCDLPPFVDERARALLLRMLTSFRKDVAKLRAIVRPGTILARETSGRKRVTLAKVDDAIARIQKGQSVDVSQLGLWKAYLVELLRLHQKLLGILERGDLEAFKKQDFLVYGKRPSREWFAKMSTTSALVSLRRNLAHDEAVVQNLL